MRKYQPSNRVPFGSFILLALLAIVGSAVVGGILWALDAYAHFYLVIVYPLIAGGIVGGVLVLGVRVGKVRSPFIAMLIGLVCGVLIYGVYHYASYYHHLSRSNARLLQRSGGRGDQ